MRTFFKILTFIWVIFCVYGGLELFLEQPLNTESNQVLINKKLKPAISFIDQFRKTKNHLPTKKEFYQWERDYFHDTFIDVNDSINTATISYFNNKLYAPENIKIKTGIDWTKSYYLEGWNGEHFIYYLSWNGQFKSDEKRDKLMGLAVWGLLALIPIFFLRRTNKNQQRTTSGFVQVGQTE